VLEGLRDPNVDVGRLPGHLNPRGGGSRRPHGLRRPTIGRRAGRWLIALVSILVVVTSVGGYISYAYFDSKVNRVTLKIAANGRRRRSRCAELPAGRHRQSRRYRRRLR